MLNTTHFTSDLNFHSLWRTSGQPMLRTEISAQYSFASASPAKVRISGGWGRDYSCASESWLQLSFRLMQPPPPQNQKLGVGLQLGLTAVTPPVPYASSNGRILYSMIRNKLDMNFVYTFTETNRLLRHNGHVIWLQKNREIYLFQSS